MAAEQLPEPILERHPPMVRLLVPYVRLDAGLARRPVLPPQRGECYLATGFHPVDRRPRRLLFLLCPSPGGAPERRSTAPQRGSGIREQGWSALAFHGLKTRGYRTPVPCGTGNRKRRTVSEVAIMARDGQVLPPVPAPGRNTLCRIVLLSIASPALPMLYTTNYKQFS